jgi:hypothetical protein
MTRMQGGMRLSLIALTCSVLSGLGSAQTQTPNTASPEERSGAPFERWKSCAQLIHPDGGYSVADLQGMFEQPKDVQQLLQNLKLAWQRDLLPQSSFYDPAILRKFFHGATVTWKTPEIPLGQDVGFVVGQLDNSVAQGMTVRVESRCWRTDYLSPEGRPQSKAYLVGFLRIEGRPVSTLTLGVVRGVFGPETQNVIDPGVSNDGHVYTPTDKGSVVYRDPDRTHSEGVSLGTTFFFEPDSPQRRGSFGKIAADDVVQRIEMQEAQHRLKEE